ncbi:alcohol dehydrogenase catalytic domain-containing protein, partial [Nocardia sp. NPDC019302]|uniref:alcohol dehydrogenase catalytic domain-containing protein n=1 Tax=Nocardia sp. NPDC019302 TaxID=3154592 RepID=UPI0033D99A31
MLTDARDAIVRPFVAGRCDGDTLPIHRRVSRAMQLGMRAGLIDPVVGSICGPVPFRGPFGIGHECIAEVIEVGADITTLRRGDVVVVPWAVSCGDCHECRLGLTAKCSTTRTSTLAAFGFGPASGPFSTVSTAAATPHA